MGGWKWVVDPKKCPLFRCGRLGLTLTEVLSLCVTLGHPPSKPYCPSITCMIGDLLRVFRSSCIETHALYLSTNTHQEEVVNAIFSVLRWVLFTLCCSPLGKLEDWLNREVQCKNRKNSRAVPQHLAAHSLSFDLCQQPEQIYGKLNMCRELEVAALLPVLR